MLNSDLYDVIYTMPKSKVQVYKIKTTAMIRVERVSQKSYG